jgi:hypothetical protein
MMSRTKPIFAPYTYNELMELLELAEMPTELMGTA